jgi:3-isopropylmalate/(R)-2-methylmalate dehydratase small subunit
MQAFTELTAIAAPMPRANVDTDMIIRVERCARVPKHEMGQWAFEMIRFDASGVPRGDFVLNRPAYQSAQILVAGANFGCGSSREMAVWALAGLGIRCVIAPSFGDIFYSNCFQNGLLAIQLPRDQVEALQAELIAAGQSPSLASSRPPQLTIDLQRCEIRSERALIAFDIDALKRDSLLKGLDEIGLTLKRGAQIDAFQLRDRAHRPWIYAAKGIAS